MNRSKQIVALLLAVLMVLTLSACGGDNKYMDFLKNGWDGGKDPTQLAVENTETAEVTEAVATNPYAYAVVVTINPKVKIYLNEAGNAVAIDYMNEDAFKAYAGFDFAGKPLDTCVKQVVKMAKTAGFLKSKGTVSIEFAEKTVDTVSAKDVVAKAETAAKSEAKTEGITVTVKTAVTSDEATAAKDISKLGTLATATGEVVNNAKPATGTSGAAGTAGTAGTTKKGTTGGTASKPSSGTVGGSTGGSAGGSAAGAQSYSAGEALSLYKTAANKIKTMSGVTVTRTREVYTEVGEKNLSGLSGTIVGKAFAPKDDRDAKVLSSQADIIKGFVVEKQNYVCALTESDIKSASAKASGNNTIVTIYVKDDTTDNQNYSNKAVSATAVADLASSFSSLTMKCKDVRVTATIDASGRLINLNTYMPGYFTNGDQKFGAAIEQWWTIAY